MSTFQKTTLALALAGATLVTTAQANEVEVLLAGLCRGRRRW